MPVHICRIIHDFGGRIHLFYKMSQKSVVVNHHSRQRKVNVFSKQIFKNPRKKVVIYCLFILESLMSFQLSSHCLLNIHLKYFIYISKCHPYYGVWKSSSSSGTIFNGFSELSSRNLLWELLWLFCAFVTFSQVFCFSSQRSKKILLFYVFKYWGYF